MSRIERHDGRAWRARAAECRAIADTFQNPETRAKMYGVAEDYERLAALSESSEQGPLEPVTDRQGESRQAGSKRRQERAGHDVDA